MKVFNAKNETILISVTATASTAVAIPGAPSIAGAKTIRIVNYGDVKCFIAVGGSSVSATVPTGTASRTSTPVLPGGDSVFEVDLNVDGYISAICDTGESTSICVSYGDGV